jgi:uroporphyrinogen decarboxylase
MEELVNFEWPTVDMMDYTHVRRQCEKYNDYAIVYGFGDIFTRPSIVRGFETFLLDMHDNPEFVHFLVKKFTDFYIEEYTRAYKESGNRIDIFLVMSDLATQLAPLIAPAMFDEYIAPNMKRLADRIHELGAYFFYHTCGEAYRFYDRLISCGVDIIDPMQRTSAIMDPENLCAEFGSRVCFHGGISVQTTLPYGTPEEVRAEVRRYADAFRNNSGYICSSAHYMQHDTPPQNILALYDEIQKC